MKTRCFALLLALCLALGLAPGPALAAEASYDDVRAEDWFYDSVVYVTQAGLMAGTGGGRFEPETVCDRAMLVTVLHRMDHSPEVGGVSFTDVPEDAYYAPAVAWARQRGIVKGYGDGRFGPNDPLTREQMLTILYRYAQYKGLDLSAQTGLDDFSDGAQTAEYALEAMGWGVAAGLVTGTGAGRLEPKGVVTRAQLAALLARFAGLTGSDGEAGASRVVLRDFTANQTALAAGTDATVTFTVYTSRLSAEIALCRDDGVTLGAMRDDGQGGDEAAGDGVYTFVWAIRNVPAGTYACYAVMGGAESRRVEITLAAGGQVTGRVCKAAGRAALPGARLEAYRDGLLSATVTADDTGGYSLYLPAGDYVVVVRYDGYVPLHAYVTVSGGETREETYLLVEGAQGEMGAASGTVTSAVTGKGLADVELTVWAGWNNTAVGEVAATAVTDAAGRYALDLPLGGYTVLATKEGCIPAAFHIVSAAGGLGNQNGSITPVAGEGVYRLVLTWGETPSDLDSHVVGTDSEGRQFHVSFGTGGLPGPSGTYICNLDVDDTNGYGPETVSLDPQTDRTYYYYVEQYSQDGAFSSSGALVQVYRGDALVAACNVPTNQGDGMYWNVLAVKNGELRLKNTVTSKPDTAYAD